MYHPILSGTSRALTGAISLAASIAMAAPESLQAQIVSAAVGVTRTAPGMDPRSVVARLSEGATPQSDDGHISRAAIGGLIGAFTGVLATVLVVHHCEAHDPSHGDGPPCAIGYAIIGPSAVLLGTVLGVVVADW